MAFSQHVASVQNSQQTHSFVNSGMQAAPGSYQQRQSSSLLNGNANFQGIMNATAHTHNASATPSDLPRNPGDCPSQLPTSAQEILKRASASTNINAESPEWAAAREQVLKSMSSNSHQPLPFSRPRGRGRGRPRGSTFHGGDRANTTSAIGKPTVEGAVVTPIRRGRGGRPRGSRGSRGRGRGGRRKREDDTDGDPADSDSDDSNSLPTTPTVTKSGRSITRPSQYNPAPQPSPPSGTKRKRSYNRKEVEQILCLKCSRGHSPPSNQIVLCDGCDSAYHQWCHDPMIGKEAAESIDLSWFCGNCLHAREVESLPLTQRVSGAELSMEERRAYLSLLSSQTLLSLLLHATSLHADLPIFAPDTRSLIKSNSASAYHNSTASHASYSAQLPAQSAAKAATHVQNLQSANTNSIHPNGKSLQSSPAKHGTLSNSTQTANGDYSEQDPYPDYSNEDGDPPVTYPRPGRGPIALRPTTTREDLPWMMEDNYEVFSHLVDDGTGTLVPLGSRKEAWLNGTPAATAGARQSQRNPQLAPAPAPSPHKRERPHQVQRILFPALEPQTQPLPPNPAPPFQQNGGSIPHTELHRRIAQRGPPSHWSPYGGTQQFGEGVYGGMR